MKYHRPKITSIREAVPGIRSLDRRVFALFINSLDIKYLIAVVVYEGDE